MRFFCSLLLFLITHSQVFAQLDNSAFEQPIRLDTSQVGKLHFRLNHLGYFKNNEYFNDIVEGYTLFGYQIHPKVAYQPTENLLIEAGFYARKDFGENGFAETQPTFTLKYQKNRFGFLFGNLEGNAQHKLIEPLYDFERIIDDRLEQGIQFLHNGQKFKADFWINWREAISFGDTDQEEIEGAWHLRYLLSPTAKLKSEVILQSTVLHRGGQINTTSLPVYTTQNHAIGFKLSSDWGDAGFLRGFSLENYALLFSVDSDSLAFGSGNGLYLNATAHTKWGNLMASYWKGSEFINPLGGDLYSSESRIGNPAQANRQLIIFRWMKDFQLSPNCHLSARFEPFYDLENNLFEYSFGLYANYVLDIQVNCKKNSRN